MSIIGVCVTHGQSGSHNRTGAPRRSGAAHPGWDVCMYGNNQKLHLENPQHRCVIRCLFLHDCTAVLAWLYACLAFCCQPVMLNVWLKSGRFSSPQTLIEQATVRANAWSKRSADPHNKSRPTVFLAYALLLFRNCPWTRYTRTPVVLICNGT